MDENEIINGCIKVESAAASIYSKFNQLFPEEQDFWEGLYDDDPGDRPSAIVFPPPNGLDADLEVRLEAWLNDVAVGSESVFIACQALVELLSNVGVQPDAMVGHSSGENSALIAAGAATLRTGACSASSAASFSIAFRIVMSA